MGQPDGSTSTERTKSVTKDSIAGAGQKPAAADQSERKRDYPPIRWANEAAALELYEALVAEAAAEIAAEDAAAAAAKAADGRAA